ncbi:hypothetical protein CHS0354_003910 [Potamilus streckersoni]|uniref:CABIT domain-containing protein n=1 Tax=Potamilus streckersoni TaxID=2493646 RepID=A0AAE0S3P4_9BIVA|nr:hypothetical protein CHS0354_003910 [Potamilus streckersoni]
MMFESDNLSYRVSEFFEKFKHDFPKIMMVAQGFHGETVTDTFDRQQVIRVHTYTSQHRVMAVTLGTTNRKQFHYSIPLDYPIKFCLKKQSKWKGRKEFLIGKLIKKKKLPVEVQISKDHNVIVGSRTFNSNRFPSLRLMHTYEEIYLLGNFINNGIMDPRFVPIPSCIKNLRLSLVTGIKGQTSEHWKTFQDEQTSIANTAFSYDLNFEREDIAICYDAAEEAQDKELQAHYEDLLEHYKDPHIHYEDLQGQYKDSHIHSEDLHGHTKGHHIHYEELKAPHREPQTHCEAILSNLYVDPFDFLKTTKSERNEVYQSDRQSHLYADPFEFLKTKSQPVIETAGRDSVNPYTPMPISIHHVLPPRNSESPKTTLVKDLTSGQRLSTSTGGIAPENSENSLLNDIEQLTKM